MQTDEQTKATPAIAVEGLTKRYGEVVAVDDLSFTVRSGTVSGFLGPNGAGKTTALKLITGLARPSAGRVLVKGVPVGPVPPGPAILGADMEPCGAHPGRTARDHLRFLSALAGVSGSRANEVIELVGLGDAADRRVGTYSLGMRQRLGLGAALLGDPELLVLDEPLNGLDPQGIRWTRSFLRERAAAGKTVLLSSHVLTEVAQTVDDVVVISRGRLVRQGSIADLERLGDNAVVARTPARERLAIAIQRAGGRAEPDAVDRLLIHGMSAAQVGGIAHNERVELHELARRGDSLEEVFFALTAEEAS
jgi:ABC-2 type transport system ATP-binding protein